MIPEAPFTASIVSHGQLRLVNALIADLIQHAGPQLKRLVVTLNIPEDEPIAGNGASFEIITIRNQRARGFGANHNRAFRHCNTDCFAVLNPDLRLFDDALGLLLAQFRPDDGLIAPLILNPDGSPADAARRVPTPFRLATRLLRKAARGPDRDFDWLAGMCLMVNSKAFRALGGFDERYHLYCEDIDLCLRMRLAGWRVRRVTQAKLVHEAQRASRRSLDYLRWHAQSLLRLWMSPVFWSYVRRRGELASLR